VIAVHQDLLAVRQLGEDDLRTAPESPMLHIEAMRPHVAGMDRTLTDKRMANQDRLGFLRANDDTIAILKLYAQPSLSGHVDHRLRSPSRCCLFVLSVAPVVGPGEYLCVHA
jgi:hypothetical protein